VHGEEDREEGGGVDKKEDGQGNMRKKDKEWGLRPKIRERGQGRRTEWGKRRGTSSIRKTGREDGKRVWEGDRKEDMEVGQKEEKGRWICKKEDKERGRKED
jgi:hypothetical protein